jgi:hypothetical protein
MSRPDAQHPDAARHALRWLGGALLVVGSLTSVAGLARLFGLVGLVGPPGASPTLAVLMFAGGGMVAMTGFKLLFLGLAGRIAPHEPRA